MTDPSPRPWTNSFIYMYDANSNHLGYVCGRNTDSAVDIANAAHIVRCVNAYDKLALYLIGMCDLAELQNAFTTDDDLEYMEKARAFLDELKQ